MKTTSKKGKYAMSEVIICNIGSASLFSFCICTLLQKWFLLETSAATFLSKQVCWICRKTEDVLLITSPLIQHSGIGKTDHEYVI